MDIDGETSEEKELEIGCVQGSSLGPRLFTLYCRGLAPKIKAKLVTYADDSYDIITTDSISGAKERIESISTEHIRELTRLGMVVNKEKTEVVVFTPRGQVIEDFNIDGQTVTSKTCTKILGITFDNNLTWRPHVQEVCRRVRNKIAVIKHIRPFFNTKQFLSITTAQVFGTLYYGSPVWMIPSLGSTLWKEVASVHYRALRLVSQDYRCAIPR